MRRSLAVAGACVCALTLGACSGESVTLVDVAAAITARVAEKGSVAVKVTLDVGGKQITGAGAGQLGMLTAGLTDDTIARHLRISPRTLRRRTRALMERLEALPEDRGPA